MKHTIRFKVLLYVRVTTQHSESPNYLILRYIVFWITCPQRVYLLLFFFLKKHVLTSPFLVCIYVASRSSNSNKSKLRITQTRIINLDIFLTFTLYSLIHCFFHFLYNNRAHSRLFFFNAFRDISFPFIYINQFTITRAPKCSKNVK